MGMGVGVGVDFFVVCCFCSGVSSAFFGGVFSRRDLAGFGGSDKDMPRSCHGQSGGGGSADELLVEDSPFEDKGRKTARIDTHNNLRYVQNQKSTKSCMIIKSKYGYHGQSSGLRALQLDILDPFPKVLLAGCRS